MLRKWGLTPILRLLPAAWLVWCVAAAATAPELPEFCAPAALVVLAITLWQPRWGLVLTAALAPAGALFAAAPARAADLVAWAFLAGWLLRIWRPLAVSPWPPRIMIPAALYGGALVASWVSLTIAGAAGVPPLALPQFLLQSIPRDHLIFSSPEAETWTLLHSLTGIAVLIASVGVTRDDPRTVRTLAWALATSMAVLAAATLLDVARQWAEAGYGGWFLLRYVRGERFSLHLTDLNAAGSLYVLAGLIAATYAMRHPNQRARWTALLVVVLPALWLTGSRSSYIAMVGGLVATVAIQRRWQPARARMVGASFLVVVVISAAVMVAPGSAEQGSARRAVNLRAQFSETSARMFASSPMFGVGIGRYFGRSAEFMTSELREIYANENAHNYFAQQLAELGLAGGLLFIWLIAAVVAGGWSWLRRSSGDAALTGLFAGTAGYLLTCLTSHPLLVPEAALPFWAAFGAVGGATSHDAIASKVHRAIGIAACVVLLAGIGLAALAYGRVAATPPEQGFHGWESAPDGTRFRWITRHAVTYIPEGPGFLRLRLRAPDRPTTRPLVVETSIAGWAIDRRNVPAGQWVSYDIPARRAASLPFRRVDLRVNQVWTEEVRLGRRAAPRPISVMAGEITWIPIR
jgi:O-antigen ligase